ncbi:GNAT family N-acetyltransferase [Naasia lichenicola]|uniref:GNAT family N-acetyltransferase n=1 Tax=Naasia lichenicola TaxID=2565933 RepID=UPI003F69B98D
MRAATAGDADAMRALAHAAYEMYVERIGRAPAPMGADYDEVAASGTATLAWNGPTLAGMLVAELAEDALLIENLAVEPRYQGTGLGSRLLEQAEHLAHEQGRSRVRLYTNEAMTENLTFYPRRGYVEYDRREEHGFRRVYFEKRLT